MTTTDAAALLRAVLRDPAEDTPRLMYADEIQDDEPERAEFIRWQCDEPTRLSPVFVCTCGCNSPNFGLAGNKDGRIPWLERDIAGQLWTQCGPKWDRRKPCAEFSRGFASRVELPCAVFLKHAAALFSAHPITEVVLTDKEPLSDGGVGTYFGRAPGPPQNWYWLAGGSRSSLAWELPPELWHPTENAFASGDAADEWLSRRCVAYGRKLAGLEPLQ